MSAAAPGADPRGSVHRRRRPRPSARLLAPSALPKAVGFWLDRYRPPLLAAAASSSARPTPTSMRAARPRRGWPSSRSCARSRPVHCSSCAARLVLAGLVGAGRRVGRAGSAPTRRCSSASGSRPNELVGRAPVHRAQHPAHAAGLRARSDPGEGLPGRREPRRAALVAQRARPSRTSGCGTTGRCSRPSASSRRSAPTTSSSTWTTTAT